MHERDDAELRSLPAAGDGGDRWWTAAPQRRPPEADKRHTAPLSTHEPWGADEALRLRQARTRLPRRLSRGLQGRHSRDRAQLARARAHVLDAGVSVLYSVTATKILSYVRSFSLSLLVFSLSRWKRRGDTRCICADLLRLFLRARSGEAGFVFSPFYSLFVGSEVWVIESLM